MKILIVSPGRFVEKSKSSPEVGRYYTLEEADWGTEKQRRAFHALMNAFWKWMQLKDRFRAPVDEMHPENGYYNFASSDPDDFKDKFKIGYMDGLKYYRYMTADYHYGKAKTIEEIPIDVIEDYTAGNHDRIERFTKSWNDFSKKKQSEAIDILKSLIYAFRCDDPKVNEILSGMEKAQMEREKADAEKKNREAS
jgi:hypothetical protein